MTIRTTGMVVAMAVGMVFGILGAHDAWAQASAQPAAATEGQGTTTASEATPAVPPVLVRDAAGRVTARATRLVEGLVIDGRLDEPEYDRVPAMSGFIQQEPREGEPATEATDAWIFFDDENLYVSARMWDSQPDRIIANEMRRDNWNIGRGASFTVALDTFHDRRNGFIFQTNPLGALRDAQVTDERNENDDWNTIWETRSARFEQGWTVEMAIPFKSLRYQPGVDQVWGINLQRNVLWKERAVVPQPDTGSVHVRWHQSVLVRREPRGSSSAGQFEEFRVQALRHLDPLHQSTGDARGVERSFG